MYAKRSPHQHMLRAFNNNSPHSKQVRSFQRFESKIVETVIPVIYDDCINFVSICTDHCDMLIADQAQPFYPSWDPCTGTSPP